jgi:hypothetical protein
MRSWGVSPVENLGSFLAAALGRAQWREILLSKERLVYFVDVVFWLIGVNASIMKVYFKCI